MLKELETKSARRDQQYAGDRLRAAVKRYMAKGKSQASLVKLGGLARKVLDREVEYDVFRAYVTDNGFGVAPTVEDIPSLALAVAVGETARSMKR